MGSEDLRYPLSEEDGAVIDAIFARSAEKDKVEARVKEQMREKGVYVPLTDTKEVLDKLAELLALPEDAITLKDMFQVAADIAVSQQGKPGSEVIEKEGGPLLRYVVGEKSYPEVVIPLTVSYQGASETKRDQLSRIAYDWWLPDFEDLGPIAFLHSHTYTYHPDTGGIRGEHYYSETEQDYPDKPDKSLLTWLNGALMQREGLL